ncbi:MULTISPECIES: hypothetical protein [Pectobacterium]|uniref:Uncharacterized protein n=1 Tax=Pectobacterium polonicum TaxID=2485124 RepID=A0ABV1PBH5_9GAMM|nr:MULTISPECIES: hypothetical protein [Pectobacterium]UKE85158.1 hypothetical protein KXZ65_09005 [Pectobacterium sp. PL152]WED69783.1 hypothetical protein PJ912_09605 [Pectobacterium colocasium]MBG0752269.1 hypothetical protein [Pectobacterium carotovorum subsp. carotovorum PCCS1]MBN3228207.1 hypothetical protein [Pectobacterium brasiliense]MCA6943767.1 hypothetical protein [Pectobacterium polaris]
MSLAWLHSHRLLSWRTARVLLWTVLLLVITVTANVLGIYFAGSIAGWEHWLADTGSYFLLWRVCLYGATVYGWRWMRRRLLLRDTSPDARRRLIRAEVSGIAALLVLEFSLLVQNA